MAKKDPNNAYGSKAARDKVLRGVSVDTLERDQKSLDRSSDYLPTLTMGEVRFGRAPTKLEAMEFLDAHRRATAQGDNYRLPREMKELGEKGEAEAKKLRGKAKGGSVKTYAKGGSVSKRADGIAKKGKTKGRFV